MMGNLKLLCNFVEKYQGTVRFGNDQFALILGYRDLVQGNIKIGRVYYIEGLKQYLFSVGQFCDADFEIAFRKSTCFVRGLQENDLLNVSPTQAWLWHQRLAHLNFDYINMLSKKDVVIGLPKLKYVKDQLCYSYEASDYENSNPAPQQQIVSPLADATAPSQQELDLLFSPLYNEYFTAGTSSVNKSSSPTKNSKQQDTPPTMNVQSSTELTTPTKVNAEENNDNQAVDTQFQQDEFINPFYTPIREVTETKKIKEAMREELHRFNRLQAWELVDKPYGKTIIKLKWLWKYKKDEDHNVIRNKARLVAKRYMEEDQGLKMDRWKLDLI
nr:hypothetical protein [Tanacetum cinerariifolium]